jgi:hypothetical protein
MPDRLTIGQRIEEIGRTVTFYRHHVPQFGFKKPGRPRRFLAVSNGTNFTKGDRNVSLSKSHSTGSDFLNRRAVIKLGKSSRGRMQSVKDVTPPESLAGAKLAEFKVIQRCLASLEEQWFELHDGHIRVNSSFRDFRSRIRDPNQAGSPY